MGLRGGEQRREIQLILPGGYPVKLAKQIGAAYQIHQAGHAQLRHDFARFLRDKLKIIRHAFRQAVVMIAA